MNSRPARSVYWGLGQPELYSLHQKQLNQNQNNKQTKKPKQTQKQKANPIEQYCLKYLIRVPQTVQATEGKGEREMGEMGTHCSLEAVMIHAVEHPE